MMGGRPSIPSLTLAAVALASMPVTAAGQEASGLFGEVINVRVINLDVVVTGPDGERVAGLGAHDFVVTVDEQPVALEYFSEIREGARIGADARDASLSTPVDAEPHGTSFLVFLDEVFPIGADRDLALDHLIGQLESLGPADRMAIVAFDGEDITLLADWSRSSERLRNALEDAKKRRSRGLEDMILEKALSGTNTRSLVNMKRERIERVTLAATSTMRSFANPAGRNVMLLLSGGWPSGYTRDFVVSPTLAAMPDTLGYQDLYRPLADTANLLGYTLYPVDMKIFRGYYGGAEYQSAEAAITAYRIAAAQDDSEDSTLVRLARETGGLAFLDKKSRGAFPAVVADTRSYYSLGFTPRWKGEDRRRRIRVDVVRPGLEVRTRRSFTDLSRQTEVTMIVESALLFGQAPEPASLEVRVGEADGSGQGFRKTLLPLSVKIPLDGLTFLPLEGTWQTELELRVAAEDGKGRRNEITVAPVRLKLPQRPPPGHHVVYDFSVLMRKRKHSVIVSLYDPVSGQLRWTRLEL